MAFKLADIEDSKVDIFTDDIDARGKDLTRTMERTNGTHLDGFGLCKDCRFFRYTATEFKVKLALCCVYEEGIIPLNEAEPIKYCTSYQKNGQMSLWDMQQIAYILDVDKTEIGFITEKDKEVTEDDSD